LPSDFEWVTYDEVVDINKVAVANTGEAHVIRDEGLLHSALAVPKNRHFYEAVDCPVALASSLTFAIARNHPFEQGNKRTAFIAGQLFLSINGYDCVPPDVTETSQLLIDVITREADEQQFVDYLRNYTVESADLTSDDD